MRILAFLFLLISISQPSLGQERKYFRIKKKIKKTIITPYDNGNIIMYRVTGLFRNAKKVIYLDTLNGFQVEVPKFLEMQETNDLHIFGSIILREEGIPNGVCINSAPKNEYASLAAFKSKIIGKPDALQSEDTVSWIMGGRFQLLSLDKEEFANYESYKALFKRKEKRYLGQFIITETRKSYIWINLTADESTFESDLGKFSEFVSKFKLLEGGE